MSLLVRWMIQLDLPEVLAIERASYLDPWSEEDFRDCLRQRNCIALVAEEGIAIQGYLIYAVEKRRLNLVNLAVDPAFRRRGVGRAMIEKLLSKLRSVYAHRDRRYLAVDVRESCLEAQLFMKSMGFRAVKVLRGYFDDSGEDGYRMVLRACEAAGVFTAGGGGKRETRHADRG